MKKPMKARPMNTIEPPIQARAREKKANTARRGRGAAGSDELPATSGLSDCVETLRIAAETGPVLEAMVPGRFEKKNCDGRGW